jgi:hypothetical protein
MLLTIVLPQSPTVDLMYAYDLANLIGHLGVTFPQVNVRLMADKQAENGDLLDKQTFVDAAMNAGSDLVLFLGDERRFAPEILDRMLLAAIPEFIEREAQRQAATSLTLPGSGLIN